MPVVAPAVKGTFEVLRKLVVDNTFAVSALVSEYGVCQGGLSLAVALLPVWVAALRARQEKSESHLSRLDEVSRCGIHEEVPDAVAYLNDSPCAGSCRAATLSGDGASVG